MAPDPSAKAAPPHAAKAAGKDRLPMAIFALPILMVLVMIAIIVIGLIPGG